MSGPNSFLALTFDRDSSLMDREQIDMLLMLDEGEDSSALVDELFGLFESESRAKLVELEQVCVDHSVLELRKIIHFIAGSAGNLGLSRLSEYYRSIERSIDSGELQELTGAAAPILEEFEQGCAAFKLEFKLG